LSDSTDGVWNGNLLEFKTAINSVNATLFQAIKYASKLRLRGKDVPARLVLVDLSKKRAYVFDAEPYRAQINTVYSTSASRDLATFTRHTEPEVIDLADGAIGGGSDRMRSLLRDPAQRAHLPVDVDANCVVPWAERYYRETGKSKADFLGAAGELRDPVHLAGLVNPYTGPDYAAFQYILDRLNDKMKKIELGALYTPAPYVRKSHELLREAIARVPDGNDYVIIDRCAGTGNLERGLDEIDCHRDGCEDSEPHTVMAHVIVNTFEQFEYLELLREFEDQVRAVIPPSYAEGDPHESGTLLNGDALSERFVLGAKDPATSERTPNIIQRYLDNEHCTIILFENPPYAEVAGIEAQKVKDRDSFGWKSSWLTSSPRLKPGDS